MASPWIDRDRLSKNLSTFFTHNRASVNQFGSTVNQTFEAFVFASVIGWYSQRGWTVTFLSPSGTKNGFVRLKFSTRGRPNAYTYAECKKKGSRVVVRHQLRVTTRAGDQFDMDSANVCLDVAVMTPVDLAGFGSDTPVDNGALITFGEAKHMSAFAELLAGFIGLVHEMQPKRLRRTRVSGSEARRKRHPAPFLYVSGTLYQSASGIVQTVRLRGYDIDVYDQTKRLTDAVALPAALKTRGGLVKSGPAPKVGSFTDSDIPF